MPVIRTDWKFELTMEGGPFLQLGSPSLEVTGYDLARSIIPQGTTSAHEVAVDVQPTAAITGSGARVVFIAITCSKYGTLTYATAAHTLTPTPARHKLDGPHLLLGEGAVSLLGSSAPTQLFFDNSSTTDDVEVQVLVGRKAS